MYLLYIFNDIASFSTKLRQFKRTVRVRHHHIFSQAAGFNLLSEAIKNKFFLFVISSTLGTDRRVQEWQTNRDE